jgi:hypothetical protein
MKRIGKKPTLNEERKELIYDKWGAEENNLHKMRSWRKLFMLNEKHKEIIYAEWGAEGNNLR